MIFEHTKILEKECASYICQEGHSLWSIMISEHTICASFVGLFCKRDMYFLRHKNGMQTRMECSEHSILVSP